ncbi:MAG: ABC transporter permease subunit [Myxococcales bacterium]|nr:ABC transporter permease subunit [Myxococcales bacterium]
MEGLKEISVVWSAELGRALRSSRIAVLLALYVLFTLFSGLWVHGCSASISAQAEAQAKMLEERGVPREEIDAAAAKAGEKAKKELIRTLFSDDEALTEALLATPLQLLIIFKLGLFFLPLFAALLGFDRLSGDIGPKTMRYFAVRSRRSSVLYGKFMAQVVLMGALMLIVDSLLCLYGLATQEGFSAGELLLTLGKLWSSSVVFSLAYVALTTLCSSLTRLSAASLMWNLLALFLVWLAGFLGDPPSVGGMPMFDPWPVLKYASVWYFRTDLLHPDLGKLGAAVLAHLGYAALFLGLAHLALRRRDL